MSRDQPISWAVSNADLGAPGCASNSISNMLWWYQHLGRNLLSVWEYPKSGAFGKATTNAQNTWAGSARPEYGYADVVSRAISSASPCYHLHCNMGGADRSSPNDIRGEMQEADDYDTDDGDNEDAYDRMTAAVMICDAILVPTHTLLAIANIVNELVAQRQLLEQEQARRAELLRVEQEWTRDHYEAKLLAVQSVHNELRAYNASLTNWCKTNSEAVERDHAEAVTMRERIIANYKEGCCGVFFV